LEQKEKMLAAAATKIARNIEDSAPGMGLSLTANDGVC
jgi:hypothetical protein